MNPESCLCVYCLVEGHPGKVEGISWLALEFSRVMGGELVAHT